MAGSVVLFSSGRKTAEGHGPSTTRHGLRAGGRRGLMSGAGIPELSPTSQPEKVQGRTPYSENSEQSMWPGL